MFDENFAVFVLHTRSGFKSIKFSNLKQTFSQIFVSVSDYVMSVWVRLPQLTIQRICPDMTLAVERDIKPNFDCPLCNLFLFTYVND